MMGDKTQLDDVNYMLSDFLFAGMFLRTYFLIRTLLNFSIYSDLYSKRVCSRYGFEASTSFYVKALFVKRPGLIIGMVSTISILFLSYVLRIFERVYYNRYGIILFDNYFTAIWCVVITMTTVGYGDVFAVSPFGRIISIINALWGAFVISLLVGSIQGIFVLSDDQKRAVADITNFNQAANSIKCSIKYFNAKNNYVKNLEHPESTNDYVPTKPEIRFYKDQLTTSADKMRSTRKANEDVIPPDNTL
jgi:hypothetical protein